MRLEKSNIIGKSVEHFMPEIFAKDHGIYMTNYL
jgi:hypothetical protein